MYHDIQNVLLSKEVLEKRVAEIGAEITRDYQGKNLLMVCILRGACVFFADLVRAVELPIMIDFMAISSYGKSSRTSGEVRLLKDLNESIEDLHVIVVEDILDSGNTLKYLTELLRARKPASLKICTLLDKPERREVELKSDYVGFEIPNEFVVGYGLDYAERYRNLPEVCILDPKIYTK